ncbi:MAG TPA: FkbM family methyltransferase [Gammaproteobacteria bacterium]|jgi:FkbM family methyltransferase
MLSQSNKLRMRYRCWRYRFKSEVPAISFVRGADLAGGTLLDIGANRGIYSIYMSRAAGSRGRVIAFEPQPELKSHLETIRRSFRLNNLEIENVGLSSERGELLLQRPGAGSGAASFHIDDSREWDEVSVPVVRLDDFAAENAITDLRFIKCDVEDHELDVFKGGKATLARFLPALVFECSHEIASRGEIFEFLFELGYDGCFYYVSRKDHRSWTHKNRGRYIHVSQFSEYEYPRAEDARRNYLFLKRGLDPATVHAGGSLN